jgi:hypothetical protein
MWSVVYDRQSENVTTNRKIVTIDDEAKKEY